ncbi:MFS general substrate transporter [Aulographum hederae CBS 113979]|uniref:MFS general substrate transporter n=1 Tax=Aulographum hederae CBS 113979 TaxID=1176131 RepID=A0A6G1GPW4_9PEZI|nr:MFS general substrate transporter [Aulographum hederae CBS 113979]
MSVDDVEKSVEDGQLTPTGEHGLEKNDGKPLKTASDGTILVPQPSDDPEEPLNWSWRKKHMAMIVLAFGTFFVKFTATIIAPGAHQLAEEFGTSPRRATYIASAASVVPAVAPFLWVPLSNRLGRRPILLVGNLMAIAFAIVVARANVYGQALACRILMAFGASVGICIGPGAISDMFFLHEKGKRMGINSFLLVCAPYLGGVAGGSIIYNNDLGWRWSMYISAILYAILVVAHFFFVPETLYHRSSFGAPKPPPPTTFVGKFCKFMGFHPPANPHNHTWLYTFTRPFAMFAYPAVVLPSLWFSIAGMTEVANTAGFPLNFGPGTRYNFNTREIGFCSFSGFIGAVAGEFFAGPLCDFVAKRGLRRQEAGGEKWRPEKMLHVLWSGVITVSAGLLLYGLELNYPSMGTRSWAPALAGILIFTFGQEILVTVIMTYMTDCYPQRAAEVSIVFQFWLNIMAYHPPFYVPQWIHSGGGAKVPYIVFAVLPIVIFPFGIGVFMWRGPQIRAKGRIVDWKKE